MKSIFIFAVLVFIFSGFSISCSSNDSIVSFPKNADIINISKGKEVSIFFGEITPIILSNKGASVDYIYNNWFIDKEKGESLPTNAYVVITAEMGPNGHLILYKYAVGLKVLANDKSYVTVKLSNGKVWTLYLNPSDSYTDTHVIVVENNTYTME
jgi:hypothetical protein